MNLLLKRLGATRLAGAKMISCFPYQERPMPVYRNLNQIIPAPLAKVTFLYITSGFC
jgi:hypothetical protein